MSSSTRLLHPEERHSWIWIPGGLRIEPMTVDGHVLGDSGMVFVKLTGRLSLETAPGFSSLLRIEPAAKIMLEMSGLEYLDSAGVGALVSVFISRTRRGKSLLLANLTDQALAALHLTRLTEVLPIYSEAGLAVRRFGCDAPKRSVSLDLCAAAL